MNEIIFETFEEFLKIYGFKGKFNPHHNNLIYRGEGSSNFLLLPSAQREENFRKMENILQNVWGYQEIAFQEYASITQEKLILIEFYSKCNKMGYNIPEIVNVLSSRIGWMGIDYEYKHWIFDELLELAGIAQHYGIPTRLLDWTFDINIALYFAIFDRIYNKAKYKDNYIVVWLLNTNIHWMNSFEYLKIVYPKYNTNPNLTAQKGVFTLWRVLFDDFQNQNGNIPSLTPLNEQIVNYINSENIVIFPDEVKIKRIKINANEVIKIFEYLNFFNYNSTILFPGFYGVKKEMEDYNVLEENYDYTRKKFNLPKSYKK